MERSRLKTIIILILAMMNLALALSLGLRLYQGRAAETALLTELRERFTAEGCALPENIPTEAPPMVVTMERDSGREQAMAEAILGGGTEYIDQGGGISVYRNGSGQATFRAGGSFSVTLRLPDGEATPMEQAEQRSRAFARAAGFETPTLLSGSGSAAQRYGGYPVSGAGASFSLRGSTLTAEGSYLSSAYLSKTEGPAMSAATALTRFQDFRSQSGAVIAEVTEISLCYLPRSTASAPMVLSPAWRIATDSGNYLVSCADGSVSRG